MKNVAFYGHAPLYGRRSFVGRQVWLLRIGLISGQAPGLRRHGGGEFFAPAHCGLRGVEFDNPADRSAVSRDFECRVEPDGRSFGVMKNTECKLLDNHAGNFWKHGGGRSRRRCGGNRRYFEWCEWCEWCGWGWCGLRQRSRCAKAGCDDQYSGHQPHAGYKGESVCKSVNAHVFFR